MICPPPCAKKQEETTEYQYGNVQPGLKTNQVLIEKAVETSPNLAENWAEAEFMGVSLGDKRLDKRLVEIAENFAAQPTAPINQASDDWADTKATYRFFANKKTSEAKIRSPHQERTTERMKEQELVLAVQDTCLIDYTAHPKTTGLGPIGTESQDIQGLVMHSTLILTPDSLPLGILSQQIWVREQEPSSLSDSEKKNRPIEEKESFKWLVALRETAANTPTGVQVVSIGDCEADVYELFVEAEQLETGLLIRAAQNRSLMEPEMGKLWDTLAEKPIAGHKTVEVSAKKDEPARTATVSVQFGPVTLKPPWRPAPNDPNQLPLPSVKLYAILVQEVNPPPGVTPIQWKLLTNQPVLTLADALECIDWYCRRWPIETFHKILKSGCTVEDCRLSTADRLKPYLALQSIVAWRIFWITHLNRTQPDAPCTLILAEHEWRALYAITRRTHLPPHFVPTVRQAVLWIAQLGGFLGRKHDGYPGITVIWRGWQRLADISDLWLLLKPTTYG